MWYKCPQGDHFLRTAWPAGTRRVFTRAIYRAMDDTNKILLGVLVVLVIMCIFTSGPFPEKFTNVPSVRATGIRAPRHPVTRIDLPTCAGPAAPLREKMRGGRYGSHSSRYGGGRRYSSLGYPWPYVGYGASDAGWYGHYPHAYGTSADQSNYSHLRPCPADPTDGRDLCSAAQKAYSVDDACQMHGDSSYVWRTGPNNDKCYEYQK